MSHPLLTSLRPRHSCHITAAEPSPINAIAITGNRKNDIIRKPDVVSVLTTSYPKKHNCMPANSANTTLRTHAKTYAPRPRFTNRQAVSPRRTAGPPAKSIHTSNGSNGIRLQKKKPHSPVASRTLFTDADPAPGPMLPI